MRYDGVIRTEREAFAVMRRWRDRRREDGSVALVLEEFVKNLQGKQFVLYAGLLDAAHKEGLTRIKTELIQAPTDENDRQAIVKATVYKSKRKRDKDGSPTEEIMELEFDGHGDASPDNVGRNIVPHIIRMAETRAKARAIRDMINVGMVAIEELGPEFEEES